MDNDNISSEYSEDITQIEEGSDKKSKTGRNKSIVWKYYSSNNIIKNGHIECICKSCGWKRKVGKAHEMIDHLALHCPKSKLTSIFDSDKIDGGKEKRCNQALTRFFVCCGIPLQTILEKNPEILNNSIKNLLGNRFFFQDVEELIKIIEPIKETIISLEFKTASLTDCFIRKGLKIDIFRQICHTAINFWIEMGGGKNSASQLVAQLSAYKNYTKPYEFEFVHDLHTIESWMCSKRRKRLSIERLQAMAKLHTYYVANISTQTNYTYTNIDNENFYEELNQSLDDEM
ncbi:10050_t:CDS:2, partial [Entrophospora sp. SA101]